MAESENGVKFVCPRSYVGRAILFLFASPLISIALYWVDCLLKHSIGGIYKLYCYGDDASYFCKRKEIYVDSFDSLHLFFGGYIRHVVIFLMQGVYIYFDVLITMAIFSFIVWIFLRYTRNGAFGKLEWFRVFAGAAGIWFLFPIVGSIVYFSSNDAYPSFWSFVSQNVWSYAYFVARFAFFYVFARKLFILAPYSDVETVWKNEIKSREFFSNNLKWIVGKIFRKCMIKYYLIFLVLDVLIFVFKNI